MNVPLAPSRKTSELLWQITGAYNDCLAHQKFTIYACFSALFMPNAARLFRRALKLERWERLKEFRQSAPERELVRHIKQRHALEKRISTICHAIWNDEAASVRSISADRPVFSAPCWTGEPHPPVTEYETVSVESLQPLREDWQEALRTCVDAALPWHALYYRKSYRYVRPLRKRKSRARPVPEPAPDFKTPNRHGWTARRVVAVIEKHWWDEPLQAGTFDVVWGDRKVRHVAKERNLSAKTLSEYVWRVRKELRTP